jgi:hypothetical protein
MTVDFDTHGDTSPDDFSGLCLQVSSSQVAETCFLASNFHCFFERQIFDSGVETTIALLDTQGFDY